MDSSKEVRDIRDDFAELLFREEFIIDKSGVKTLEILGANFITSEETIFGKVNTDYVERELQWYKSQSLNVNDIPGGPPAIWKQVSSDTCMINSNYGWCIDHPDNFSQYENVLKELRANPNSRRAIMIYTRPSIWNDYNRDGMSDFICTNTVQYFIRDGELLCIVNMRSNDGWAGYRNDLAWQMHVLRRLASDLGVNCSQCIIWNVGSLHFYESQFYLIHHYSMTGETNITLKKYSALYPDSPWASHV